MLEFSNIEKKLGIQQVYFHEFFSVDPTEINQKFGLLATRLAYGCHLWSSFSGITTQNGQGQVSTCSIAARSLSLAPMGENVHLERTIWTTEASRTSCCVPFPCKLHPLFSLVHLCSIIKGVEVKINARKEAGIVNPSTGDYLELDIYLPSLQLAFEFQVSNPPFWILLQNSWLITVKEKQHYLKDSAFMNTTLEEIRHRDKLKRELTSKNGITLIIVPCWWDKQLER